MTQEEDRRGEDIKEALKQLYGFFNLGYLAGEGNAI